MNMKQWIICLGIMISWNGLSLAQQTPKAKALASHLDRIYAQATAQQVKLYYANPVAADVCEAWSSCAVWAFNQYTKDPAFQIVRAELKTQRKVYRHRIAQETHLFVEAVYNNRTVYVEFTTPHVAQRIRPYRYIPNFPQ